jgi:hypothetical protein
MADVLEFPSKYEPGTPDLVQEVCASLRAHHAKALRGEIRSFRLIYRDEEGATYMVDVGEVWTDMA